MTIIRSLIHSGSVGAHLRAANALVGNFYSPNGHAHGSAVTIPSIYCNATCTRSVCKTRPNRKPGRTPSTKSTTDISTTLPTSRSSTLNISSANETTDEQKQQQQQKQQTQVQPVIPVSAASTPPTTISSASQLSTSSLVSPRIRRDPNNWLYKRLIRSSSEFWTKTLTQLNNAAETGKKFADDRLNTHIDKTMPKPPPMDVERAKQMTIEDIANIQAKVDSILQQMQVRAKPLWFHAHRALTAFKVLLVQLTKKLECTPIGQKFSEPIRRFLQESCEATQERSNYEQTVSQMNSKKNDSGSCSTNQTESTSTATACGENQPSSAAAATCSTCGKPKK